MEIKNKEIFRAELKAEIAKHIKEFPVFFFGNIVINVIVIAMIVATASFLAFSLKIKMPSSAFGYGLIFIAFLLSVLSIMGRDFFKNIRILKAIRAKNYELEVEDYELDNLVEFIEGLPMSREDVEQMKISLSFGKLIDILDLFEIIYCEKGVYNLDLAFKYRVEEISDGYAV